MLLETNGNLPFKSKATVAQVAEAARDEVYNTELLLCGRGNYCGTDSYYITGISNVGIVRS